MPHLVWPRNLQSLVLWFCILHWPQCLASCMQLAREGFGVFIRWMVSCFSSFLALCNHCTFSSLSTLMSFWDRVCILGSALLPFWIFIYSCVKLSQEVGKKKIIAIL